MRNRWYHPPALHRPQPGHERKVGWLELFFDLIFVATIIQLGDALADNVSLGGFGAFCALFTPVWLLWTGQTFFNNRFLVDDFLHRVLVFVQMFAIGTMAVSVRQVLDGELTMFAAAYAVARLVLLLSYLRVWKSTPEARHLAKGMVIVFAVDAALWLLSVFVEPPLTYWLWGLGVAANLWIPISRSYRALMLRYPPDALHMSERYGLLTIIVLGESFVKILSHLAYEVHAGHGMQADIGVLCAMALLITCCVWWIYFDDVAGSRIRVGRGTAFVWIYAHLPMTAAITAVGVATKKVVDFDLWEPAYPKCVWLLCGALAMAFFFVGVIDSVTERRQAELSDRSRVNLRFGSTAFILLMAAASQHLDAVVVVSLVCVVCVAQVVFDLLAAPEEADPHAALMDAQAVFGTGEVEADREEPAGPRRRDVSEAVRKGTPSDLRRDVYFFLIEGSWKRLFAMMGFGYLIMNLLFGALFMLEPTSITGLDRDPTFGDAFFFSVQTMSTIGYGTLHPGTVYGDTLVTVEAALGLLLVALATGVVFAKVSRPTSSVLFSKPVVVTRRNGVDTLMFRLGNARGNDIVDARVRVSVLLDEVSHEGHAMRTLYDLELRREYQPMFALSWTVMHRLDASSPLHDVDLAGRDGRMGGIVVTMTGHDGTYAQTTHARYVYWPEDIRVGERFVDVVSDLDDGRLMIDYARFHDTVPDDATESGDDRDDHDLASGGRDAAAHAPGAERGAGAEDPGAPDEAE